MNNNSKIAILLERGAISIIVIIFFLITSFGYWWTDDFGHISSLKDYFTQLRDYYMLWGGRWLPHAIQQIFINLFENCRLIFDIFNAVVFCAFLFVCSRLCVNSNDKKVGIVFLFTFFFWFLCPVPNETLFWAVGSIEYLWTNVLLFAFLLVFLKKKDENSFFIKKIILFVFSVLSACNTIPCVSISGALVCYYLFNIKELRHNAVPLVLGFIIGSAIQIFAPGNFVRASIVYGDNYGLLERIKDLLSHPFREIVKYKALWLFVLTMAVGFVKGKDFVKKWAKENIILLLSLGWSIIAFSVVFRPDVRALSFTEPLAIILLIKFILDKNNTFFAKKLYGLSVKLRYIICGLMFLIIVVDGCFAIRETIKQHDNNAFLLEKIKEEKGVLALDDPIVKHRMAYGPFYPHWIWSTLANKLELDSVHVYPFYCQDKYFTNSPLGENVYVDGGGKTGYGYDAMVIIRQPQTDSHSHYKFSITYTRPQKWYKSWLNKFRNYQYERTVVVERNTPDEYYDGYEYYIVWFTRENASNIKSVNIEQVIN